MPKPSFIPQKLRPWIEARRHFNLTHAQVQMARELGMNPKKLGGMANHKQQPWKMPLPRYLEHLYKKQFGKEIPDDVRAIETKARERTMIPLTLRRDVRGGRKQSAEVTSC